MLSTIVETLEFIGFGLYQMLVSLNECQRSRLNIREVHPGRTFKNIRDGKEKEFSIKTGLRPARGIGDHDLLIFAETRLRSVFED